jgi:hypothetical protein
MDKSKILKWSIIGGSVLFALIIVFNFISFSNNEIILSNSFDQKYNERTAFYDKMWKTLSQKSQVTLKNDSSFRQNVNIIMQNRKDAPQVFMKWITESNPNANYDQVSALYQDLSRSIEAQREGFFVEEKYMQDIVLQHSNLIQRFPGSFYNLFLGRNKIKYSPITSDITDQVIKTGKDNNIKVF